MRVDAPRGAIFGHLIFCYFRCTRHVFLCSCVLFNVYILFYFLRTSSVGEGVLPDFLYLLFSFSLLANHEPEDQPGKVANPALSRGQLNRGNEFFSVPVRTWVFIIARRVQPSRPASACSFSIRRLNLVLTHGIPPDFRAASIYLFKPPYAIGSVPSLSGHAIAYRWRSLPIVRRRRASSPQGSSNNGSCHFAHHRGPIDGRLAFPTPTIGMNWAC